MRPLTSVSAGGMAAVGDRPVLRVETGGLDFFAPVDWSIVEVALLDVLNARVTDLLGLEKLSSMREAVKFATSGVYLEFVHLCAGKLFPLPDLTVCGCQICGPR